MSAKRRFRTGCLIAVVGCILLSFPGCNESGDNGDSSRRTFPEGDGPLTPYAETLTVKQVRYQNPNVTYVRGESKSDNFIRRLYKEKLNMVWESVWTTDPSSYYAKLNLDIASNDLPDVFMVNDVQLKTVVMNGQAEDLTDYYDYYASELLKKNIEHGNGYLLQYPTVDNKLYAIPLTASYAGNIGFMWLRTDWMKKLGLEPPTTFEAFCDYIRAVKKSGISSDKSSSGFSFLGVNSVSFNCIAQCFGAYYDYWLEGKDGKLVYGSVQPEMREALLAMQKMYNEGLIDRDFAAKNSTEQEMIAVGQYGVLFGQYFYPALLKGSVLNDKNAEWNAYPIPGQNGKGPRPMANTYVNGYVVVRKGYEHPEALLKAMNLWAEIWLEGGSENAWLNEKMTTTHKSVVLVGEYALPYQFDGVLTFQTIGKYIREILSSDNPAAEAEKPQYSYARMTYALMADENEPNYISGEGWSLRHIYECAAPVMDSYTDLQFNLYQGMLSDDAVFDKTTLDKMMMETFTNIIMGEDISAFDAFVKDWYDMGGSNMAEEVNNWYAQKKLR